MKYFTGFVLIILFAVQCTVSHKPIPQNTLQLVLVLVDSVNGTQGKLYQFDREPSSSNWNLAARNIPVIVGKNGLAWGKGLQKESEYPDFPTKKEGDGKSPSGVFYLSTVFGFDELPDITIPFLPVNDLVECIDDVNSHYYNQVVNRTEMAEKELPDWNSSEKMRSFIGYYEQGIIVDHNVNPISKGSGSCIFIHNWKPGSDVTSGCTAMIPKDLTNLIHWLNVAKKPVLAQLTLQQYDDLKDVWALPSLLND